MGTRCVRAGSTAEAAAAVLAVAERALASDSHAGRHGQGRGAEGPAEGQAQRQTCSRGGMSGCMTICPSTIWPSASTIVKVSVAEKRTCARIPTPKAARSRVCGEAPNLLRAFWVQKETVLQAAKNKENASSSM